MKQNVEKVEKLWNFSVSTLLLAKTDTATVILATFRACRILNDNTHTSRILFTLLPSAKWCQTTVPRAVSLLNSCSTLHYKSVILCLDYIFIPGKSLQCHGSGDRTQQNGLLPKIYHWKCVMQSGFNTDEKGNFFKKGAKIWRLNDTL